ncbi:OmpW family protein [Polaromonas sp. CG_9.11]|uniref:OmpW/AlkL family protein n=1 Tax=Polaromonas sp. CG_9.11 TaxID=2787730 RepID=UPI0018CBB071|nr:OmpW family outer membrane protein [Polaromonas sp. CG_9.11]MBG6076187.1 outer membrane protein [Polaromonas sp. CG_9.11]
MNHRQLAFAGILAACAAAPSMAQQNTLKLGISNVQPHSGASDVSGPFTPGGISLDVRDKTTPFISYTREISDPWDVELALGIPPKHDIVIKVSNPALPGSAQALSGQVGATIRQVAPTLFVNYKFFEKTSVLRPFVGAGINYTRFNKTRSTAAGDALNGGPSSISLEDSVGLALQAGLAWRLSNEWSVSASLATARVTSKITTNTLGIERHADITFKPQVFTVAMAYSF